MRVVALLTGRRLAGIRLHSDSSGVTVSVGRPRGPGMVAMLAAGYPAPALLGLGGGGRPRHRSRRGAALGPGAAAARRCCSWCATGSAPGPSWPAALVVFAVTWWLPGRAQSAFGYLVTWFLLLAGVREVFGLIAARDGGAARGGSDADQLARLTHLPAGLWVGLFLLVALAAAGGGAVLAAG